MIKKILIIIACLMMSHVASAETPIYVSFLPEGQTVSPGALSGLFTVHWWTQDADGNQTPVAQTGSITLSSDSPTPTGKFFSSNGTTELTAPVTVAKNSSNKYFYYQNSIPGTYTLTANLTFGAINASGSASQRVTIGTASTTTIPASATSTSQTATTTTESRTTLTAADENTGSISAHDSPLPTSAEVKIKPQLVADAGRERIGVTHGPLTFSVLVFDQAGKMVDGADTIWSYGDGTTMRGNATQHTYAYPGDYVVVANVQKSDLRAVDRTLVHIASPELVISRVQPGILNCEIEIENRSKAEINLAQWSLSSGAQSYVFPGDTILLPGKKIILPYSVSKISLSENEVVSLRAPDLKLLTAYTVTPAIKLPPLAMAPVAVTQDYRMATTTVSLSAMRATLVALSKQMAPLVTEPYVAAAQINREPAPKQISKTVAKEPPAVTRTVTTVNKPKGLLANFMSLFK